MGVRLVQPHRIPEAGGWGQGRPPGGVKLRTGLKGKEKPVRQQRGQRVLQAAGARPAKEQKQHGLGTPGNEAKVSVTDRPKTGCGQHGGLVGFALRARKSY